ncbi:hypothetical protein, partial [Mycobacterium attenuatum]|uniref:hypothetical protein n=1 Tax=Mycobacterium attenuatum TaxID=2341086 RepID=UPI000F02ABD5
MDVVLGVAVAGPVARLALVGAGSGGTAVIDQSSVDVAQEPISVLTETVAGTDRLLADEGHRLIATRLCWADHGKADELRQALVDSGVHDVDVLSESEAATALLGAQASDSAVLLVGDQTASLSVAGAGDTPPTVLAAAPVEGDATVAFDTLMARLGEQSGAPGEVLLVGTSAEQTAVLADQLQAAATMRVQVPDDPTFALARGAALVAGAAVGAFSSTMAQPAVAPDGDVDATTYLPPAAAMGEAEDAQLAYSEAGDYDDYADDFGEYDDYAGDSDDYADDDAAAAGRQRLNARSLVISNAVVAFMVIGFASLAVAVAVAIRPTAASEPVQGYQNAQPGKFMPLLPTEQQAPVPPPPVDNPTAGFQGGTVPAVQGVVPRQQTPPVTGGEPVAPAPALPGVVPAPIPIPVPIIIPPWPGWSPGVTTPPTTPVTTPPTTPPTTPVTTPPTTPVTTPPTTPVTTPPTTPVTTPPTTQVTTPPTTMAPVTTTVVPTTVPPTTVAPTTVAPQPTQQPTQEPTQAPTQQVPTQQVPTQQQTVAPPAPQTVAPAPQPPIGGGATVCCWVGTCWV